MKVKAKSVEEYLADLLLKQRKHLKELINLIKKYAPDAVEVISYGMPAYKHSGRILVYCSAFTNHYSLFPGPGVIDKFKDELKEFETSKGTIKFSFDKPLPKTLISKIIIHKVKDNVKRSNTLIK